MYPSAHDAMYPNHRLKDSLRRFSPEKMERVDEIDDELYEMFLDDDGISKHIDAMVPVLAKRNLTQERKTLIEEAQQRVIDLVFKEEIFVYAMENEKFIRIPAHQFLAGTVNWKANSFSLGDFKCQGVTIYEKMLEHFYTVEQRNVDLDGATALANSKEPSKALTPKSGGRPSHRENIQKVYILNKSRIDFYNGKINALRQVSHLTAIELGMDIPVKDTAWPKGLGEKAINAAVGDQVDAEIAKIKV